VEATAARATLEAVATAGLVPEGLIVSTATPDLRDAVPPDAASTMLAQDRRIDALLSAIEANDVDGVLSQFDWQTRTCGAGGRGAPACEPNVAAGTDVPTLNTGIDTFYVSEATLRRYLARVMRGTPLALRFAGQRRSSPEQLTLAFDGPSKMRGELPLADDDADLSGFMLGLDLTRERPVVHFDVLSTEWSAVDAGLEMERYSDGDLRILTIAD
jgi:hypothetical protein